MREVSDFHILRADIERLRSAAEVRQAEFDRLTAENARLAEALRIAKHDVDALLGAAHDMQGEVAEAVLVQAALADRDATIARLREALDGVLPLFDRWRASLHDGAFTHSDGLRFVIAFTYLLPALTPAKETDRG